MEKELKEILSESNGERDVCAFLAKHPELIRWLVCRMGGHTNYVIKEFPLGSKYRVDFVVATSYSGAWEIHLIELEPVNDMVITKAEIPSNRLNKAISQTHEWADYIKINLASFQNDLSDWCIKKDLLKLHTTLETPTNYTGNRLNDPNTHISFHYHIVIGRRCNIDDAKRKRMQQMSTYPLKIVTYDGFVDLAKNIDLSNSDKKLSVFIRDSEEF